LQAQANTIWPGGAIDHFDIECDRLARFCGESFAAKKEAEWLLFFFWLLGWGLGL